MSAWLDLQTDFAQAKDAVFSSFDVKQLTSLCNEMGLTSIELQSQANDAALFLQRPDLGRLLANESETRLKNIIKQHADYCHRDLLIVVSGGLSPIAVQNQIPHFLNQFVKDARAHQWTLSPIIINSRGRVALGDQINHYFKAGITIMLIGERPGLSTPDSLGIYFTYNAKPAAPMNSVIAFPIFMNAVCLMISSTKLAYLINKSLGLRLSGFRLKDDLINMP